ncbi:TSUP family transporter [Curvibacter sp. RS43]|uniref:TSUP family transporter n=1 Tax=Curvibacter microcysteis TaxID=3026419 RepID=UPI0023621A7B|nr:TSUP family transporter [Curvibacter sp. RS43]MDD0812684.1 TSUP family transporter [Curvibacter sp. RS43]
MARGRAPFSNFVGSVLALLAVRIMLAERTAAPEAGVQHPPQRDVLVTIAFALFVGVVGGTYGLGGGALMAPALVAFLGRRIHAVAGALWLATLVTSVAGVLMYSVLSGPDGTASSPDWPLAIFFGVGGLAGTYMGAIAQKSFPEDLLRVSLALLVAALIIVYLLQVLLM